MSDTGNFFLKSLENTARQSGMTAPVVRSWPEWVLFDEQHVPGIGKTLVAVALFRSAVDIANRIADEAAAFVAREAAHDVRA